MKARKTLAIVTAVAMMLLPTQIAFAADPVDQIVTGDAIVDYVDPASITNLVVPTSAALGFTLDPQNLAATQGVGEWKPEDGGSIIPASVNIVANKSAVPIKTTVDFSLVDDAEDVVLLDSSDDVNTGTDKNMYLSFVPANAKTSISAAEIDAASSDAYVQDADGDATFDEADLLAAGVDSDDLLAYDATDAEFGQFVETDEDSGEFYQVEVPAHDVVAATTQTTVSGYSALGETTAAAELTDAEAGTSLAYVMDKAVYYVVRDGNSFDLTYDGAARNDNYDTASFIISGVINKNADWSGYDADTKISVTATYSFDILTDAEYDAAIAAKVESTYNSVETVAPVAPAVTDDSFAIEAGTAEEVAVTLGSGSLAATGITSVTYEDSGTKTLTVTDDYTFSGTTLTFTADYIDSLIDDEVDSRTYTVTFNNSAATTDTLTLTYTDPVDPVAPSISADTTAIASNTAEDVTVSLGAGSAAATGITSVTYQNSGTQTLTATTDYTFSGTTLSFTSAYVNSLISGNVTSRTYTVTFNNSAATTDTITLTYTPPTSAPSIATTSYAFTSGNPVAVTVNLGTGSLAATGITSVQYLNTSDAWLTLNASNYTISGTTVTFTSAYIDTLVSGSVTSRSIKITFNDTAHTAVVITLHP